MTGEPKSFVADTSVLIKWLISEPEDIDPAMRLQDDFIKGLIQLRISSLTLFEINNFLGRAFPLNKAVELYSHFQLYKFEQIHLSPAISFKAFQIMEKSKGSSFYDSSQHATAIETNALFLTADKKYYESAKKLGHILLIRDY